MMNDSLAILKQIYKPYRYTKKGKTTILETSSGSYIVKEKINPQLSNIFQYLKSRNFDNFPKLIDESRAETNVFEYLEDIETPMEQKSVDMINLVSNLHKKTTYFKEVSEDKFKEIYINIASNITDLKKYYDELIKNINYEIYMAPSHYLLIRNYDKINSALIYAENNLIDWYEEVKNDKQFRVATIHNNLSLDHFIKGDKDYLISWDQSTVDSPIKDLWLLYKKEYLNINFKDLLSAYEVKNPLNKQEKELLYICMAIPPKITLDSNEFENCLAIRKSLDYVYKTELAIGADNSKQEEE